MNRPDTTAQTPKYDRLCQTCEMAFTTRNEFKLHCDRCCSFAPLPTEEDFIAGDLAECKELVMATVARWYVAGPQDFELEGLVNAGQPDYFHPKTIGAAIDALKAEGRLSVDEDGNWRLGESDVLDGEVEPGAETETVRHGGTVVQTSTGTVIVRLWHDDGNRNGVLYVLQAGPYQLQIREPDDAKAGVDLIGDLVSLVEARLSDFQAGPYASSHGAIALCYVRSAQALFAGMCPDYVPGAEPKDDKGPGGAHHHYLLSNGQNVLLQTGPRGEPGSIAGVLDPDLLRVASELADRNDILSEDSNCQRNFRDLLFWAQDKLADRVVDRVQRQVFGTTAA